MRGKVGRSGLETGNIRITPAYAGKSSKRFFARSIYQDHPRLCGEKRFESTGNSERRGSPPPMRGKGGFHFFAADRQGIPPAYAGKRACVTCQLEVSKDHPRLCGEKHPLLPPPFHDIGSPPPMRGKVIRHTHAQDGFRITPAYAGKSHPLLPPPFHDIGSPPPMRGKVWMSVSFGFTTRITPAYAGKSE